jgi:hypothetical protein
MGKMMMQFYWVVTMYGDNTVSISRAEDGDRMFLQTRTNTENYFALQQNS